MSLSNKTHAIKTLALRLLRSNDCSTSLAQVKAYLPPENFGLFVAEVQNNSSLSARIPVFSRPKDFQDLQVIKPLRMLDPQGELSWIKAYLIRSVHLLEGFFQLSGEYSRCLLNGDYENASSALDRIEETYGCSIWLIKTKIAFLQLTQGLQAQKAYSNQIKTSVGHKGVIAYMTFWISLRNEGSVTAYRFGQRFNQNIKIWSQKAKNDLSSYMQYHILGNELMEPEEALNLPRLDFSKSLIDFYESFLALCRIVSVSECSFKTRLYYVVQKISEKCSDQRLGLLVSMWSNRSVRNPINTRAFEAYNLFIQGKITEANNLSMDALKTWPSDPYLLYTASITSSLDKNPRIVENGEADGLDIVASVMPLKTVIIDSLSMIFTNGIGAAASLNKIEKLSLNFSNLDWSGVFELCLFYLDPKPKQSKAVVASLLKITYIHPVLLKLTQNEVIFDNCVDYCIDKIDSIGVKYSLILCNELSDELSDLKVLPELIDLHVASDAIKSGEYSKTLLFAKKLTNSEFKFFQRQGFYLVSHSLVLMGMIEEACSYIAKLFVENSSFANLFPLKELSMILKSSTPEWKSVRKNISLSIVLDAVVKQVSNSVESYRAYACEDFLTYNGIDRPSKLVFDGSREMIYYFRHLCIESIMDVSTAYDSPEDVENERIAVLRKLIDIDKDNAEEYSAEIKTLLRGQIIKTKMDEIEQNKIYVDLEKVREWAHNELQESYQRYLVYLKLGLDPITSAKNQEAVEKNSQEDYEGLIRMEVPENESFSLINSIIVELREAYCLSPEFGLDRYLSTRLRHGAIESRLRKSLDLNHIITKKEGKKGEYKRNYFWEQKVGKKEYYARDLQTFFNKFSEKYDKLIAEISLEWVAINRGKSSLPLFMHPIRQGEVAYLQSKISIKTTFNQFLDIVLNYFEERLVGSLEVIREKLNNEGKSEAKKALNILQAQVSRNGIIKELDSTINLCRTEVQVAFDRVIEWFSPASSLENNPFPLEDAISVAEAIVKDTTPEFSANITVQNNHVPIMVKRLPTFIDIIMNAFENIVKRSGLDVPVAYVECTLLGEHEAQDLKIRITNELGDSIDKEVLVRSLEQKKQRFKAGNFEQLITSDHGSGFFKIYQGMIDLNPSSQQTRDFDFCLDENTFVLELKLPLKRSEINQTHL